MIRNITIFLLALFTSNGTILAQKSTATPRVYQIAAIEFKGNRTISSDFLLDVLGLKVGDKFSTNSSTLSSGIKRLWKQKIVNDVSITLSRVEDEKAWLLVEVEELPRLEDFEIKGLKGAYVRDLEDEIGLLRGRILSSTNIKNASRIIRNYLGDKGYAEPQIFTHQQPSILLDNASFLIIKVDPGPRIKIAKVTIEGNNHLGNKQINKELESSPGLFGSSRFHRQVIMEDRHDLLNLYRKNGFLDVAILDETVERLKSNRVNVTYRVEEGPRYYVGDIRWRGNASFDSLALSKALYIHKGDVYNSQLLQNRLYFDPGIPDISSMYMDQGYMFINIQAVQTRTQGDTVDLEIRIREGKKARIGDVTISGNHITSEHVIRREIRTLPGNTFSRSEMVRSQRELAQLGYFDPTQLQVTPSPNPKTGLVDINYSVVERSSDEFLLSGGWGGSYGFIGSAGIVLNNFSAANLLDFAKWRPYPIGDGQKLALRFQSNASSYQNYSATFSDPWFRGKPNTLTFSLTHSSQDQEYTLVDADGAQQAQAGNLKLSGGTVSLTRRLTWPDDYFTLTHGLSFYHYGFDNYQNSLGISSGTSNNLNFFTTLARNNIDNINYPRRGSLFSMNLEFTPPHSLWSNGNAEASTQNYAWLEYYKWMLDYRKYKSLVGDLVLELRVHAGLLGAYNTNSGVGPFERFYLGGSGLGGQDIVLGNDVIGLRGYPDNSLVPIDGNGIEGGVLYNKFSVELRYPVVEQPWGTVYVLGFAEAGNNWAEFGDYDPFSLKKSAGLGIRFILPGLGQIGLDWGNGFDPLPGTIDPSGSQFHISVGRQIR